MILEKEMKHVCCLRGNRSEKRLEGLRQDSQTGWHGLKVGDPLTTTGSRGGVVKDTGRSALTTSVEATALSTQMGS